MATTITLGASRYIANRLMIGSGAGAPFSFEDVSFYDDDGAVIIFGAGTEWPISLNATGDTVDNDVFTTPDPSSAPLTVDDPLTLAEIRLGPTHSSPLLVIDADPGVLIEYGDYLRIPAGDLVIPIENLLPPTVGLFSNHARNLVAQWIASGGTWPPGDPAARWVGLLDTTGTELTGGGYARQTHPVINQFRHWPASGLPTGPSTVRYLALFDAVAAGNEILRCQYAVDKTILAGASFNSRFAYEQDEIVSGAA